MIYDVRVTSNITLDFLIDAPDEETARECVEGYVKYVDGGKIKKDGYYRQYIRMELPDEDKLTHCFFMDSEIETINEVEDSELAGG